MTHSHNTSDTPHESHSDTAHDGHASSHQQCHSHGDEHDHCHSHEGVKGHCHSHEGRHGHSHRRGHSEEYDPLVQHRHHSHAHAHHHHVVPSERMGARLLWATGINFLFTIVQVVGGLIANSLSLLSDALHNLADATAILLAYIANRISRRRPTHRKTFGYSRFEIIAAFINASVLIAVCLFLLVEAYRRFMNPEPIRGALMLIIATLGLIANLVSAIILHHDKAQNLNVRAAYMHLLGDTLSSVAVILGGLAIWLFDVVWVDPLITVLVSIYLLWHTWGILKESVNILMQSTPEGFDPDDIINAIEAYDEVGNVHHVHIWQLNDQQVHCEAHVCTSEDMPLSGVNELRLRIETMLHDEFNIHHTTLQFEHGACQEHSDVQCLVEPI